jgi:hypothetical protein
MKYINKDCISYIFSALYIVHQQLKVGYKSVLREIIHNNH